MKIASSVENDTEKKIVSPAYYRVPAYTGEGPEELTQPLSLLRSVATQVRLEWVGRP